MCNDKAIFSVYYESNEIKHTWVKSNDVYIGKE